MKDVIRIAKNCSKSLVSLNASPKHLSDFGEVFKHAKKLEHFGIRIINEEVHPFKISNKALECVGTHLKLCDFRILLDIEDDLRDSPLDKRIRAMLVGRRNLDNGVRAMLEGCSKLERLDIDLCLGGLTDVGLGYIGKYGHNLTYLSLSYAGEISCRTFGVIKSSAQFKIAYIVWLSLYRAKQFVKSNKLVTWVTRSITQTTPLVYFS
ncbi:ACT domain-containing protein [Tanacetum coccineum]